MEKDLFRIIHWTLRDSELFLETILFLRRIFKLPSYISGVYVHIAKQILLFDATMTSILSLLNIAYLLLLVSAILL